MIVIFSFGNHNLAYTNIRDIDLSMYDEVMLTSMSAPEFKLTMDYDVLGSSQEEDPINDFSYWWREFKQSIFDANIIVTIKDSAQNTLAQGMLYLYNEDRENFAVEFTCKSDINVWLNQDVNGSYYPPVGQMTFSHNSSLEHFRSLWIHWFGSAWGALFGYQITYQLHEEELLFNGLANIVKNREYPVDSYYLKPEIQIFGTRADALKLMAQTLNAKFVYDGVSKVFHIIPFKYYKDNPIDISGFISNEEYDSQEQVLSNDSIFSQVKTYRRLGSSYETITNNINSYVFSRLTNLVKYKKYDIWGYANQIIYSGFTIRLDGNDYYVQDIEYESETLDSLKSFKAKGIRFF